MTRRRTAATRAAALLAVAGALAALTGCQRDTPQVTVSSGRGAVHSTAQCYDFGSAPVTPERCARQARPEPRLVVASGQTIGVDVDGTLAHDGWVPAINGQRLTRGLLHDRYYRFALGPDTLAQSPLELQIVARGSASQNKGVWLFRLDRAAG